MTTLAKRNFASGEVAPALYARNDLSAYMNGLRTCRNFFVRKHGGVQNRPGTIYVGEVKDSSKTVRLIPFVFNTDQTYMLEFGDQYMRVIRDGEYVVVSGVTAWSNATAYVVGDLASRLGVNYYCISAHTNQQPPNATYWHALTGTTYEIPTPYVEADLALLDYNQSGDIITLTHTSYPVRELARSGHTTWTLTTVTFAPTISAPTGLASSSSGTAQYYVVTAVARDTYEESLPSERAGSSSATSTLSWTAVSDAIEYNVYKLSNGVYGFIGVAGTNQFTDATIDADTTDTPPSKRNPFAVTPLKTVAVNAGGTGYVVGEVLTVTQTGASSGKLRVDSVSGGAVTAVSIVDFGTGYSVANGLATTSNLSGINCTINITAVTTGNFPKTSTYYQQRQMFANTTEDTEKVYGTKSGNFKNLTISSPLQDDDAVTFPVRGRQVNSVKYMVDLGKLIIFTSGAEAVANGDQAGILRAGEVNLNFESYNGSADLRPLIINDTAIYVQERGNIVRDLVYQITPEGRDGYKGTDLTIMSVHLFEKFTLVDWAFTQAPNPIAWIVRDDGVLLGLTYLREHKIFAWHKHDFTGGTVENVASIPEGNEDVLYLVIKRTIDGNVVRYVEKFSSRRIDDIIDAKFLDSCVTYDGRNTGATTMTLSGGTTWAYDETITLTASVSYFVVGDIGNEIHITGADGTKIRCEITAYTSGTVVSVRPHKTVPVAMRSTAFTNWGKAVDEVSGVDHLEGEEVSVFADGFVVASPYNDSYTTKTVASGVVSLDKCYVVIHVGRPYLSDLETLDIDQPEGESLVNRKKLVATVTAYVEESRGIFSGANPPSDDDVDALENLYEYKARNAESYEDPVDSLTGPAEIKIKSEWNNHGRVFIRQVDPLPLSILGIMPDMFIRGEGA